MKYSYDIAILGIRLQYQARSLPELRQRLLSKYLKYIGPDQRHWPLVPSIVLLGTNDPRVPVLEIPDPRLSPSDPRAVPQDEIRTNPVISLIDWKNRATSTTDSSPAETDQSN